MAQDLLRYRLTEWNSLGPVGLPEERVHAKSLRSRLRLPGPSVDSCPGSHAPVRGRQDLAQNVDELKKTAVKVFLDCDNCDLDYIKTEITFVNYVRDRLEAQVHILITTQATGSGGREYTLTFIGQNECRDLTDVQKFFSRKTDTEDEIRRGLVKALKLGLMSYVGRTPIACRIAVDYSRPEAAGAVRDRWKSWVFSLTGSGYFSGEESYMSRMVDGSFSANRITAGIEAEAWGLSSTPPSSDTTSRTPSSPAPSRAGTRAASTSRAWASTGRPAPTSRPNPRSIAISTSASAWPRPSNTISFPTPNRPAANSGPSTSSA